MRIRAMHHRHLCSVSLYTIKPSARHGTGTRHYRYSPAPDAKSTGGVFTGGGSDAVSVYLDDGPCVADVASTIVDMTGPVPRLLRRGVIPVRRLREVVALIVDDGEEEDA